MFNVWVTGGGGGIFHVRSVGKEEKQKMRKKCANLGVLRTREKELDQQEEKGFEGRMRRKGGGGWGAEKGQRVGGK